MTNFNDSRVLGKALKILATIVTLKTIVQCSAVKCSVIVVNYSPVYYSTPYVGILLLELLPMEHLQAICDRYCTN